MAFSGGTFSRTFDCTTDRDNGVKILASKFDTELDGFATGLSTCILKDGTQTCTAAIPFAEGLTVPDNKTIILGTNSDITIQYDESTNDSLEIAANVEGAALGIVLKADQGDDNADQHKVSIADGGTLTLGSKISGSFVSYLTHTPNSTVASSTTAVAGNLTVGGDLTLGSGAVITEAELEAIDGVTAGTVTASKAVIVDSNKDIASFRNVTLTGELDAGSLDISGDADIDGTLETDALSIASTVVTATAAELNYSDTGAAVGTVVASKVVTADANKDVASFRNITLTGELDAGSLDISGDADIDGTLEADAMTLAGTAITATATLDTGISNNNVPVFTSGVADDDFLRVAGTAIEGRSASEVLSDIGGQASLTFGISNTNAVKIDSSSVADDEYARFTANGLESRATSEVLSDIGAAPAAGSSNIVTTGALNSGSITSGFGSIDNGSSAITTTGVITGGTLEATADTSAGDNAAIGFTSAEGLILTGQGSTSDITLKNDADAVVFSVPTGTDDVQFPDNAKATFGNLSGGDLQIYHDASSSRIVNATGNLKLQGDFIELLNEAGTENYLSASSNSSTIIHHNGTGRLTTTASGVEINGGFTATDGCTITTADNNPQLTLTSTDTDAGHGPRLNMVRNPSEAGADGDNLGQIFIQGYNDAGTPELIDYFQLFTEIADASDGTEDARQIHYVMTGGSQRSRIEHNATETVINEDSQDIDFRVESNGNANMLVVDAGTDKIGIGTASPTVTLEVANASNPALSGVTNRNPIIQLSNTDTGYVAGNATAIDFATSLNYTNASIICRNDNAGNGYGGSLIFATATTGNSLAERMRIDNGGNVLVNQSSTTSPGLSNTTTGLAFSDSGRVFSSASGTFSSFNRNSSAGSIVVFRKDGTIVSAIGVDNNGDGVIDGGSSRAGIRFVSDALSPRQDGSESDNVVDLGKSDVRFDDVFATNGTIQTSDQNEKQDIASLTTAEITAAKAISKLFKTFKWKDKVAAKGDAARTHSGVIAQEVQTAMTDAGLDASKYAFWCSDTWWETSTDVPAVEAVEYADAVFDDDNNLVSPAVMPVEARDAYTYTTTYKTADEAPEGATKHTRLGVRYPELLAFIGAATEQRLADIETRLSALEA